MEPLGARLSLSCQWGEHLVTHKFLVMPAYPTLLLGRDLLLAFGAALGLPSSKDPASPLKFYCLRNPLRGTPGHIKQRQS